LELPGHGLSRHRPPSSSYHLVENIVDVLAFIDVVSRKHGSSTANSTGSTKSAATTNDNITSPVTLIGHSLGGIICSLLAAAAPEKVEKLILLDSLGPLTDETKNVLPQLKKAVRKANSFKATKMTVYPTKEMAAAVRMMGIVKVDRNAAELLVSRGLKEVEGGFSWTSDSRLLDPSFLRFSEDQIKAVFKGIECPVSLICGETGYFSSYEALKQRLSYFQHLQKSIVTGGHHFHMDGDVRKTAELVNDFIV